MGCSAGSTTPRGLHCRHVRRRQLRQRSWEGTANRAGEFRSGKRRKMDQLSPYRARAWSMLQSLKLLAGMKFQSKPRRFLECHNSSRGPVTWITNFVSTGDLGDIGYRAEEKPIDDF